MNNIQFESIKSYEFHQKYPTISPQFLHELAIDLATHFLKHLDGSVNNDVANTLLNSINNLTTYNTQLQQQYNQLQTQLQQQQQYTQQQLQLQQQQFQQQQQNQIQQLSNYNNDFLHKTLDSTKQHINDYSHQYVEQVKNALSEKTDSIIRLKESKLENTVQQINHNLNNLTLKMTSSQAIGKCFETIYYDSLLKLFPSTDISYVSNTPESCDISFVRDNKPTILIELKKYRENVSKKEVEKFIRDTTIHNCCGIMISQTSGICNRANYQIEYNNNNLLIYLTYVENNTDPFINALNIIDSLYKPLSEQNDSIQTFEILPELLLEIQTEYNQINSLKTSLVKISKEHLVKLQKEIDNIKMPNLENLLIKHFASASNTTSVNSYVQCTFCGKTFDKRTKLSGHLASCKSKHSSAAVAP